MTLHTSPASCRPSRMMGIIALLLLMALLVIYYPMTGHQFLNLDDPNYITENLHVQNGLTWGTVLWSFKTLHANFWHPLTWLSHMLDWDLFGAWAGGHHMVSLALHGVSTILLFLALGTMTKNMWLSALAAAIFSLHPLRVESVAWAAERKDVLSGVFWMLTLLAYVYYAANRTWRRYLLVVGAFVLGNMAKPMLVTLPVALLLLDYWPLRRFAVQERAGAKKKTSSGGLRRSSLGAMMVSPPVREKLPMLGIAFLFSMVAYVAQDKGAALGSLAQYPLPVRIGNAMVSYVAYIGQTFWPFGLAPFYPHPGEGLPFWKAAGSASLLIALSILVIRSAGRHPYLLTGWLWYLITLLPVIGIIQVGDHGMADRYTYIPQIGLIVMLVWGAWAAVEKIRFGKQAYAATACILLAACLIVSHRQVGVWQDSISIFSHTLKVTENNSFAHSNMGDALVRAGKPGEAEHHFREAVRLDPDYAKAFFNLGIVLEKQGRYEEAIEAYGRASDLRKDYTDPIVNTARIYEAAGKTDEAVRHLNRALQIRPDLFDVHHALGMIRARQGDLQEAIRSFSRAIEINPYHANSYFNRGIALGRLGQIDPARQSFAEALRVKPEFVEAHIAYANLMNGADQVKQAEHHYRLAIRYQPGNASAHMNLGTLLARQGRLQEAVVHFEKAAELNPDSPLVRANLVQCHLLLGNREAAEKHMGILRKQSPELAARLRATSRQAQQK